MKNFHCSFRLPAESFLIPSLNFRVQENSFRTNLRMSMPRRWRWISGVIPVAYPPPGIWQGRNGKWLGQKSQASKTSLPTLQFVGSMCLFSWVCRNMFLGTYLHATHTIHYQARCAPDPSEGENRSRWEGGNFATKAPGVSHRFATWVWKGFSTWSFEKSRSPGPKLCFLGLVFVAS